ncbi:hypothetical protein L3X38_014897 [Prunus dulcis]|uniref:Uncharacterized protein n=1 Tax=Prunus dulcis TaxID=3755 RepID=A0AAD4ZIW3_PRUDU|nr:hypothetical protein L3X38_014897 [Prunus dulcis]
MYNPRHTEQKRADQSRAEQCREKEGIYICYSTQQKSLKDVPKQKQTSHLHLTFTSYFTSFPFQKPILSFLPPSNFFLPQLSFYNSNSCAVSAIWIVGTISTRKCGLGEWWSLDSSLKVEDYFGAVKVKNLPWAEPTENSE